MTEVKLPEPGLGYFLPDMNTGRYVECGAINGQAGYTAAQMRDYAADQIAAAVAAERQACIETCEAVELKHADAVGTGGLTSLGSVLHRTMSAAASNCAAALRERGE